jgi:hypothetical protein
VAESTQKSAQPEFVRYVDEFRCFLQSDEQKVLLFHGRWGTGKTYFWRHFVEAERQSVREFFYSYVSLFGASSVTHVKSLILFGGEAVRPAEDLPSLARRIANFFASKRRYLPEISLPHVGNIGSAIGAFDELLIKKYLVCFDDLERRSNQLDLEQFFGLVALLKEQNDCRVVIICNESELSEGDTRRLDKYREKIVDRQLTYEPLFEQNFRIVFPDENPSIREIFEAVGLNNIRVFQHTRWCVKYFEPHIKECHAGFIDKFNQQCTKLACVHFALSKEITLDQLKSTSWFAVGLEDGTGLGEAAADIVRNLQFLSTDADDFIADYLCNGYCDTSKLKPVILRLNQEYQTGEAEQVLTQIWSNVWHSYKSDSDEIARAAEDYVMKYPNYIRYRSAAELLDFVKKIAPSFDSQSKKQSLAKALLPTADIGTLRLIKASCESTDIVEEATTREQQLKSRRPIEDFVSTLADPRGWNPADFEELNEYSEQDFFEWLRTAHRQYLLTAIAEVIVRGQLESTDNKGGKEIGIKFRKVFDRLAERSALDKERTTHVFATIRRRMQQSGRELTPDVCPPEQLNEPQL